MILRSIGIFATTFPRLSIESGLDAIARYGLSAMQYNMACAGMPTLPDTIPSDLAARIGIAAAARGINIAAVTGTFNMVHPDLDQRRQGLRRLRVLAGACAPLGSRCITLCTGTRDARDMWRGHPDNSSPEAWRDLLASMEAAVAIAEEFDIVLGVKPDAANVADSAARAQLLLREMRSARIKIILDPASLFRPGGLVGQRYIMRDAFDTLGPHMIMASANDVRVHDGEIRRVAAGSGLLDYSLFLSLISSVRVPLLLQGLLEEEVPWSLAFLRATADGVDRRAAGLGVTA